MKVEVAQQVEAAFEQVEAVVGRLVSRGRSTTASAVKLAMLALDEPFDEHAMGFAGFQEFLEAAQSAGHVRLERVGSGPNPPVVVQQPLPQALLFEPTSPPETREIRKDLWQAFVDWSGSAQRYFDERSGRALRGDSIPEGAPAIEVISRAVTLTWMREFAGAQFDPAKSALEVALADSKPARTFAQSVRRLNLIEAWIEHRRTRVAEHIDRWAEASGVSIDPFGPMPEIVLTDRNASIDTLRAVARQAIDRMTEAELNDLKLPLRVFGQP